MKQTASEKPIVISGLPPGKTGTGKFVAHLMKEGNSKFNFYIPVTILLTKLLIKEKSFSQIFTLKINQFKNYLHFRKSKKVILLHPQFLGYKWCIDLIENSGKDVWLYLLDSSYFCVRSYNYIPGESGACLRCVTGKFENADKYHCKPFPSDDSYAKEFISKLFVWGKEGKIKFLAQNENQAILARKHFRNNNVNTVGLWTVDMEPETEVSSQVKKFDVIYHGFTQAAKGFDFAVQLAEALQEYKFLFPIEKPSNRTFTANCYFENISWNTGLKQRLTESSIILVPSLWSAPIEGALVKSIFLGDTIVVDEKTGFAGELPEGVVIKISGDVKTAAEQLKHALTSNWHADLDLRKSWTLEFENKNRNVINSILKNIQ